MLAAPWVCQSCSRARGSATFGRLLRRHNSTAVAALPPVLLDRARKLTAEHAQLSQAVGETFDHKTAKRIAELAPIAGSLRALEKARASVEELNGLLQSDDAELRVLARDDLASTGAELDRLGRTLSAALVPRDPYADMPCLLEILPGPGGVEGRFFADRLLRMYRGFCARHGLRVRQLSRVLASAEIGSDSEEALQEAVLELPEAGAYGLLRGESGMHRVQRVPVTEVKGRTHTSAVAVWVLPAFPDRDASGADVDTAALDDPNSDFYIDPADVRCELMRSSGAGGQHVNKTESAVRLTHVPTGIAVKMQESRSQQANREGAWKLLRSRLAAQRREAREEEAKRLRSALVSNTMSRGDKIRTYNFNQNRCTDHRSGMTIYNLPEILDGGPCLDTIMESVTGYLKERSLLELIAAEQAAAEEAKREGAKDKAKAKAR